MKKSLLSVAIFLIMILINVNNATATLIWDASFDTPLITVGPWDSFDVYATLFNNPSSDENITFWKINFANTVLVPITIPDPYIEVNDNFPGEFAGKSIAPGQNFNFFVGRWIPRFPPVPLGSYTYRGQIEIINEIKDDFVTVDVVPEPATMILFGIGGLATALIKRRRKIS